jgi:Xaa-Pro aminopeptidase
MTDISISRLELPRFSLRERESRWGRLREAMAERRIDCLITPHNTAKWGEFQADTRYVSQIGNGHAEAWCVFPLRGEVTAFVRTGGPDAEWELGAQDWVTDVRGARGWCWSEVVIERLRELDLGRAKIAVAGLEGYVRGPEGVVNYTTFKRILDAFSGAVFENADPWLRELRMVKSDEEVVFLERATELAEASIAAMVETAGPGVPAHKVYAAMINAGLMGGGEYPWMNRFAAAREPRRTQWIATQRRLEDGDILVNETDGKYAGYCGQVVHHVQVGSRMRDDYRKMMDCSIEMFTRVLAAIGPGVPLSQLVRIYREVGAKHGYTQGGYLFIGRGLGDDPPMGGGGSEEEPGLERKLQAGNVFCWKPRANDGGKTIGVGDTVAVISNGARRLGKRKLEPLLAQGGARI